MKTMNNQGFDALAALAAAASNSSPPNVLIGTSSNNNKSGGPKEEVKSDKTATSTDTSTPQGAAGASRTQPVNASLPEIAAQQWQQVIANAASSISALSGAGGPTNLALLGMQQQLNQATAANPNIIAIQQQLAMQQQLNYYQLLAHAATQQQRQFGAHQVINAANTVPGTATSAAQALSQVLGVPTATAFPNVNGTFIMPVYFFTISSMVCASILWMFYRVTKE